MQVNTAITPKINANLNTDFLKIVAIVSMFIDHLGKIIFPDILIMQIIGRIAFPIFAYCIVVGCLYTSNIKKYAMRLAVFGIISQPIYVFVFDKQWYILNIILYLLIGLLTIYTLKEKHWFIFALLILLACLIDVSYGINGILLMIVFYLFRNKKYLSIIVSSILLTIPYILGADFYIGKLGLDFQIFAILSLPLIYTNTYFNFKINKYVFYYFYPIHLVIIYLLLNITLCL